MHYSKEDLITFITDITDYDYEEELQQFLIDRYGAERIDEYLCL